jgi:hypothetical protein
MTLCFSCWLRAIEQKIEANSINGEEKEITYSDFTFTTKTALPETAIIPPKKID